MSFRSRGLMVLGSLFLGGYHLRNDRAGGCNRVGGFSNGSAHYDKVDTGPDGGSWSHDSFLICRMLVRRSNPRCYDHEGRGTMRTDLGYLLRGTNNSRHAGLLCHARQPNHLLLNAPLNSKCVQIMPI